MAGVVAGVLIVVDKITAVLYVKDHIFDNKEKNTNWLTKFY